MTRTDWEINIRNAAESVAVKYGNDKALFVFSKYGATCFENLSPIYYSSVFDELELMDEDE